MPAKKPSTAKPSVQDDDEQFPTLAAQRAWDRAEHIRRAMAAGMTREQAERHADQELAGDQD